MKRPGKIDRTLERIKQWREICPDLILRSTFIVGFPGETEEEYEEAKEKWQNTSPISGIFKSFTDAPGGFKEELREINFSIGAEYSYNQQFFLRAGYFNENKYKGNRKYFSFGAGFSLNVLKIDAAYMVATAQTSPLDQTLRFTLSFDMDGLKDLLGRR